MEDMIEEECDVECVSKKFVAPTLIQKLTAKKQHLENELKKINEAIDMVTKNPDVVKVLDMINSLGRLN